MTIIVTVIGIIAFAIAGPIIGCLLAGLDRIISARMQGRVGPPLLQPYYDVRKLFSKENASVNTSEHAYILFAFNFTLVAGGVFFSGGNLLLSVFLVTLSSLLFIVAAYSSRSPYSEVGAARETLQAMAYEPMLYLCASRSSWRRGGSTWRASSSSMLPRLRRHGSRFLVFCSCSQSSCASRPSISPCRTMRTRKSFAASRPR